MTFSVLSENYLEYTVTEQNLRATGWRLPIVKRRTDYHMHCRIALQKFCPPLIPFGDMTSELCVVVCGSFEVTTAAQEDWERLGFSTRSI
jgi:hypothetical protein